MKTCKAVIYIRVPTMAQAHDIPCEKKRKEILWEDIPDFARQNVAEYIRHHKFTKQRWKKTDIGKMERNGLMPPRFVFPYI